jgi:hypothetical protein
MVNPRRGFSINAVAVEDDKGKDANLLRNFSYKKRVIAGRIALDAQVPSPWKATPLYRSMLGSAKIPLDLARTL